LKKPKATAKASGTPKALKPKPSPKREPHRKPLSSALLPLHLQHLQR
jgi:hypothetical protein